MGLAISRSIIEAHGGRLWAMANTSGGAIFQFTLPVRIAAIESEIRMAASGNNAFMTSSPTRQFNES
jgi:hypothetical protein